jgi:mannonate dehydratase
MVVGCQRAPTDDRALSFFKRHAVDHICGYPPREGERASWTQESLARVRELCERHSVALDMVQLPFLASNPIDASARKAIMLGREPERQQEIDEVCEVIRNCAAVGIPAVKYNLNLLGVLRTAPTEGRGGSRRSTWRLDEAKPEPELTAAGKVTEEQAWERIAYFLERVVPVAEQYRVRIACHPHDPGAPCAVRGPHGVERGSAVHPGVPAVPRRPELRPRRQPPHLPGLQAALPGGRRHPGDARRPGRKAGVRPA